MIIDIIVKGITHYAEDLKKKIEEAAHHGHNKPVGGDKKKPAKTIKNPGDYKNPIVGGDYDGKTPLPATGFPVVDDMKEKVKQFLKPYLPSHN